MSAEDRKPGSWVVHHDEYAVGIGEVRNDGTSLNFADLHVGQFFGDHGRAMKKARLIAAAPELLDALRELLTDMVIAQRNMRSAAKRDSSWDGCAEAIQPRVDAARAAIAKATGGAL